MGYCGFIMLDKFRGMNLVSRFPCIVAFRVSLPFDEVLKSFRPSELSACDYSFDFVFFFPINKVRRGSREVWAVRSCFMIRS